jgi:hypothetical protein
MSKVLPGPENPLFERAGFPDPARIPNLLVNYNFPVREYQKVLQTTTGRIIQL